MCMLLHNFIKGQMDIGLDPDWRPREYSTQNSEPAFPLVTDNNEVLTGGRPSNVQESNRIQGEAIRRSIAVLLNVHGFRRPYNGMKYNQYGHVYFDGV